MSVWPSLLCLCVFCPLTVTTTKRLCERVHMCMTGRQNEKGWKWHDFLTMWYLEASNTSHSLPSTYPLLLSWVNVTSSHFLSLKCPLSDLQSSLLLIFQRISSPLCASLFECAVYVWLCLCVHSEEWYKCVPEWISQSVNETNNETQRMQGSRAAYRKDRARSSMAVFYIEVRTLNWLLTNPRRLLSLRGL